jgi:uncharacterized protein YdcH (DUF465 family)
MARARRPGAGQVAPRASGSPVLADADRALPRRFIAGARSRGYRRIERTVTAEDAVSTQAVGGNANESLLAELVGEHRRIDERIKHLERQRSLTSAEQAEVANLKKQKLRTKDRIARLSS